MAEGKIRVKFEEKDSDKLISAIKALNVETKKLSGQSLKYRKELKKLDGDQLNLRNNTNILGSSFLGFGNILTSARAKLLLFAFATNQASQVVNNLVRTNANIGDMGRAFNNLSDAAGFSSDTFNKLNEAVDGTVRKTNLMQQANNAMLLGIFESSDQMAEMFDVAQRLGQALGRTASESIESLVTGLGRQSKLMLDNLGIVFDTNQSYEEYAATLGKTASALTDQEKKQAFVNKAVAIANDLVKQSGEEVLSTNAKLDQLSVSFENLQAQIGEGLTPVVILAVESLTKFMDSIDVEEIKSYSAGFASVVTVVGLYQAAITIATIKTVGFSKALIKTGFGALAVSAGLATGALLDYFNVFDDDDRQEDLAKSNKSLESSFKNLRKAIPNNQTKEFNRRVEEQAETFLALNPTVQQLESILINVMGSAKDFKIGDKEFITTPQSIDAITAALDKLREPLDGVSVTKVGNFGFDEAQETLLSDFFLKRQKTLIENNELERSILIEAANATIEDETALRQVLLDINTHFDEKERKQKEKAKTRLISQTLSTTAQLLGINQKNMKHVARIQAAAGLVDAYSAAQSQFALVSKTLPPPFPQIAYAVAIGQGIAQAQQITKAAGTPIFEQGGLVGGRRHSQGGTMIEAERGEFVMSRNAVSAIGVENLNRMNQGQSSGGGSINININGGMISPDFVENELAESIREAVRRGADFGIS